MEELPECSALHKSSPSIGKGRKKDTAKERSHDDVSKKHMNSLCLGLVCEAMHGCVLGSTESALVPLHCIDAYTD